MNIDLDAQTTIELTKIVARYLYEDLSTLLGYFVIGLLAGFIIAYVAYKLIKKQQWFKRSESSSMWKVIYFLLRATFYLGIIGVSSTVGLIIGSNKIVDKEVVTLVDEGISYFKTNYFEDLKSVEELFGVADAVYSSGYEVNEFNHKIADLVVDQMIKENQIGFLQGYFMKTQSGQFAEQLEELERGMLMLLVGLGLEQIGAEELMDEERLDDAFYAWLHTDKDASLGSINSFLSTQIGNQLKPIVAGIWLPFLLISTLFILINAVEVAIHYYRKKRVIATHEAPN